MRRLTRRTARSIFARAGWAWLSHALPPPPKRVPIKKELVEARIARESAAAAEAAAAAAAHKRRDNALIRARAAAAVGAPAAAAAFTPVQAAPPRVPVTGGGAPGAAAAAATAAAGGGGLDRGGRDAGVLDDRALAAKLEASKRRRVQIARMSAALHDMEEDTVAA